MKDIWKNCPKMGRQGVKTGTIYIKLYMSVFIRQNFFHPPNVELPKNLVICFKETLASLSLDTTKTLDSCLLLLNSKQWISTWLLKLQITENHLRPPKTIYKHPKLSAITLNQPLETTRNQPESTYN